MGNPTPLVMLHRRNPDKFAYLGSGLDAWKVKHTKGGFAGWTAQVKASRASVIVLDIWRGTYRAPMQRWLSTHGYHRGYIGPWQVFITPKARRRMAVNGVAFRPKPTFWPHTTVRTRFTKTGCSRH